MPKKTAVNGWDKTPSVSLKAALFANGAIADFISPIPIKSIPKPRMMEPICCMNGFLKNTCIIQPIKMSNGANEARLKAVICAVIVVPILAPIITPTACDRLIRPEWTKPITIMSVAEEL